MARDKTENERANALAPDTGSALDAMSATAVSCSAFMKASRSAFIRSALAVAAA